MEDLHQPSQFSPSVRIWDKERRSLRHELLSHTDNFTWIGISLDNQLAAFISWGGTGRFWDLRSGACLHILGPFIGQLWCGVFSSDEKYLAISQQGPVSSIYVHDMATGQLISRNEDDLDVATRYLDWSPDESLLVSGGKCGMVRLWYSYTGEEKMR